MFTLIDQSITLDISILLPDKSVFDAEDLSRGCTLAGFGTLILTPWMALSDWLAGSIVLCSSVCHASRDDNKI